MTTTIKINVEVDSIDAIDIIKRLKISDLFDITNGKTVEVDGGYGYLLPGLPENRDLPCYFFFERPDHWDDELCVYVDENGEEVGVVDTFIFKNIL